MERSFSLIMSTWQLSITKTKETLMSWVFSVQVKMENGTFDYTVNVQKSYYKDITGEGIPVRRLVEEAFFFLLERESCADILSEFDLQDVATYFPEFSEVMRDHFH